MMRVLIVGPPGVGKGILSNAVRSCPAVDYCEFVSYPNKGDTDPAEFDLVIQATRDHAPTITAIRRKVGMRMTVEEAEATRAAALETIDFADTTWPYRYTVEQKWGDLAQLMGVEPWDVPDLGIFDGDRPADG